MADLRAVIDRPTNQRDPERGFSLIELIIVIVILGVLVAIAIPVYNNIQDNAKQNAANAIAANVASEVAAKSAQDGTAPSAVTISNASKSGAEVTVTGATIDALCVKAVKDSHTGTSGPGCSGS